MELSKNDTAILKGMGILGMVLLHLFATKDPALYTPNYFFGDIPITYYIGLMGDACLPIYLFVTGYAFYQMFTSAKGLHWKNNLQRILKLYINLWVIIAIFLPICFLTGAFSFNFWEMAANALAVDNSYNGAWWYVEVYIIFVLFSPILIKMVQKYHSGALFLLFGAIYFASHIQRYKFIIPIGDSFLMTEAMNLAVLLGTSIFSFTVGAIFAKEKLLTRMHHAATHIKGRGIILGAVPFILILFHAVVESSIIAPINGIIIICVYALSAKRKPVQAVLGFFSRHSTNIWLIHMFFYQTLFSELVFAPQHPVLVFLWLLVLCIAASYVIQAILNPIYRLVDSRQKLNEKNIIPVRASL